MSDFYVKFILPLTKRYETFFVILTIDSQLRGQSDGIFLLGSICDPIWFIIHVIDDNTLMMGVVNAFTDNSGWQFNVMLLSLCNHFLVKLISYLCEAS